jgi:DNA-binding MarR family transcriptional regulator
MAIDPQIHPPARLQLMTMLTAVTEAEFVTLREALGVSDSVLSKHVSALAAEGYVRSRKGILDSRRTTWIGLTSRGRKALQRHVAALRALIDTIDTRGTGDSRADHP